jgi:hypothetical protein
MVSGLRYSPIVTGVMEARREKPKNSRGIGQHYADLVHDPPLFVGHNQKLESVAQPFAISHDGSKPDYVRRQRYGKFERNHFAGLQLAAKSCADAVLSKFIRSAPVGCGHTLAEDRYLNPHVKAITRETALSPLCRCCRL